LRLGDEGTTAPPKRPGGAKQALRLSGEGNAAPQSGPEAQSQHSEPAAVDVLAHVATGTPWRQRLPRCLAGAGLAAAVCAALFLCYVRMSSTVATNSDGAANALQAWDMLHGNLLLRGWHLSDVAFYTTELPEYMLVELAHGLNSDVVHVAAALTYAVIVILAALLARGTASGRQAAFRMLITGGLMLSPQLAVGTQVLLSSPDHVGTVAPVLIAWLVLDRCRPAPFRWWVPALVALVLAWAMVADVITLYIGIAPLLAVCLTRAFRATVIRRQPLSASRYELALALAALAALVVGLKAPAVIHALGGYSIMPAPHTLAPLSELPTRLRITGQGLLLLFGADFFGLRTGLSYGLVLLHLAGVALAGWAVCRGARRFFRDDEAGLVVQVLTVGTLIIVAAYLFGKQVPGIGYSHEMAPALPFASVLAGRLLAGRLLAGRLSSARLVPVTSAVLVGYVLTLGINAAQPAAGTPPPGNAQLISWLAARHLRYGLSGYWQADALTLASGNEVQVRTLAQPGGGTRLTASGWESQDSWYDPRLHDADFVLLFSGQRGFAGQAGLAPFSPTAAVSATFGQPAARYRLGAYTVLVWHRNLLRDLPSAGLYGVAQAT
jgi:hypothetical protein